MKLAIMQPYFLPYVGYFQLMASADAIIIYDNIKYTKKGWINRNRRLQNGTDTMFSLPLKKGSDSLDVVERELAADFVPGALLNQLRSSYARAPYFAEVWPVIERIVNCDERNLFGYVKNSIIQISAYLGLTTTIYVSSEINADQSLKSQDRVIGLCHALGADIYINPIGGLDLYDREAFRRHGVELRFLKSSPLEYEQLGSPFVPGLSIVDVLMFNPLADVRAYLSSKYELL